MKPCMVDYINTICENDFRKLHDVIEYKFRKFRSFYWLLKDHSEQIDRIFYDSTTDIDTLRIDVSVRGFSSSDLAEILCDNISPEEEDSIVITFDDQYVCIEIFRLEEPKRPEVEEDSPENN